VLDHLGGTDPLLRALVHSDVVFAEANLDTTGGGEMLKSMCEYFNNHMYESYSEGPDGCPYKAYMW